MVHHGALIGEREGGEFSGGGRQASASDTCLNNSKYHVTSLRKGFVILCIILMKEALGGDLITKWKVLCSPLTSVSPLLVTFPLVLRGPIPDLSSFSSLTSFVLTEAATSKLQMLELKASLVPDISVKVPMVNICNSESLVLALRMSLTASSLIWTIVLMSCKPTRGLYPSPMLRHSAIPEQRFPLVIP